MTEPTGHADDKDLRIAALEAELTRYRDALREQSDQLEALADRQHGSAATVEALVQQIEGLADDLGRARDEAEAAARAKATFLANMSHEIRTPMNAIIGMTCVLRDMPLTAEQRDCVNVIHTSGEHLLSVINDILDYSKLEAGGLVLERQPMIVRECLEGAFALLGPQASARRIDMRWVVHAGVPVGILGDLAHLRQVLINLLANAVKFTPEGGKVVVTVALAASPGARSEGPPTLEFTVEDSGIGMTPATIDRLFLPFTQADASTTRVYGGTGLGLSISKRLVEAMGGQISARSDPGRGSTFTFTIVAEPATLERAVPGAPPPPAVPNDLAAAHPLRILVAEDNPMNRKVAKLVLQRMGYAPEFADDGSEALAAVAQHTFDVVFMDVHMPLMDGLDATREICRRYPDERPRIIGMTASTFAEDRQACTDAGMDDYLAKPVRPADVAAALQRAARRP